MSELRVSDAVLKWLIFAGVAWLVVIISFCALAAEGYYWDGYRWIWRGAGGPTRPYPPQPYPLPPRDCYGQACVDEFHRFGGRDQRTCFDQWGNLRRC